MLKVYSGGTNDKEEEGGVQEVRSAPTGRVTSELGGPMVGSVDVDLVSLGLKKSISLG